MNDLVGKTELRHGSVARHVLLSAAVVIAFAACGCSSTRQRSIERTLVTKQKLYLEAPGPGVPAGGAFAVHPRDPNTLYYYTLRSVAERIPQKARARPGLWVSFDRGRHWESCGTLEDFGHVLVHPETGELFAIVNTAPIVVLDDGQLVQGGCSFIARSMDACIWLDVSPGGEYVVNAGPLFWAPGDDHRLCFYHNSPTPGVYVALDDSCVEWQRYQLAEWDERYPQWNWNSVFEVIGHDEPIFVAPLKGQNTHPRGNSVPEVLK